MRLRSALRELGFGRLLFRIYHRPVGRVVQSVKEGGPVQQRRTARSKREMIEAAHALPELEEPSESFDRGASFLSGAKYWHETLFCMVSLQIQTEKRVPFRIFDDGSLSQGIRDSLLRVVPWSEFVSIEQITDCLEERLPANHFPALRNRRKDYPHLRKLTDIHSMSTGWSMVLDSDMLFFRPPDAVFDWLEAPSGNIYMQDVKTAYGYSDRLMERLSKNPVPPKVNVGLYGLRSDEIDWSMVEHWCHQQISEEGPSYFQEQALTALLIAQSRSQALPREDYVVWPDRIEAQAPTACLHHYVAESKRYYYQSAWQRVRGRLSPDF